jgi:hypothetical protein
MLKLSTHRLNQMGCEACFQRPGRWGCTKASMACQMELEEFVGKDAGLWEAIHLFSDFHVDITINSLFT